MALANSSETLSITAFISKDLNTKEKLEELDKNYDRHNQEVWQNFATFCIVGLSLVGIAVGGPTVIKNIHKIAA